MAFVIVEQCSGDETGRIFPLSQKSAIIGRIAPDSAPDIMIQDDYISRQHAEICHEDGCYTLCDMGSANGTEINGKHLEPYRHYPLKHNSKVGLGIVSGIPRVILCFKESPATVRAPIPQTHPEVSGAWLKIDENRKEVVVNNQVISLSKKEYGLISLLHSNKGRVFSKDEIIDSLWPKVKDPGAISDAAIDQLVYRLRKKIEPDFSQPRYLISKKGFGFMLTL